MSDVTPTSDPSCSTGVLEQCLESFTTELTSLGYCAAVVRKKRATARAFARWAVGQGLDVATIDDATIEAFLADSEVGHPTPKSNRRCTLARFLARLRAEGATLRPELKRDHSYAALLQQRYVTYLRSERGLAEETVGSYRMWVSELVRYHFGTAARPAPASGLDARAVQDFLLERTRTLSPGTAQLVATALRSFLRFLFLCGEIRLDLALAVPAVPTRRQAGTHPYLCPEEVERLLDACDRKTANGRRDHAILLLLARLGVRACEVAALELGDLRWRSAEIVVRGKGQVLEHVPLLPDVGAALALYLREGRPKSKCRSVFLRNDAPRVGLTPDGVGWVVRRALARAGLRPPRRGSHLLRFSLATTMIRRGASMAEIGEVLRHRSPETTEIYAKVDFEALRAVALPWVGTGGGR
jgi:site-specific recombinase XerD